MCMFQKMSIFLVLELNRRSTLRVEVTIFHALQKGLGCISDITFNYHELRQNLSLWFQDEANVEETFLNIGATPSDIIPNIPDVGGIRPKEGWKEYLKGKDWKFWGKHIAVPGRWLGAIELPAANGLLGKMGFNVRITVNQS